MCRRGKGEEGRREGEGMMRKRREARKGGGGGKRGREKEMGKGRK